MRKIILFSLILFSINSLSAQIFEGQVAEYDDQYDMSELESYTRINNNGGLLYNRKGFISFKYDEIIFAVGKTDTQDEIYMELDFQYEVMKNATLFSPEVFGSIPNFRMLNGDKKQISVQYFTFEPFKNVDGGQFVISLGNKMYIMKMEEDVLNSVLKLYRE